MMLTAIYQKFPDEYIGFVEELPGANTYECEFLREGSRHTVYVNRKSKKTSTIHRHKEIIDYLAEKIHRDLEIPKP